MNKEILAKQVAFLRQQGKSIRGIASELAVSKGRVERTLNRFDAADDRPASPVVPPNLASAPFVGRLPEIESLQTALRFAVSGRGQMAMLAGEPGIGKTRLSREMADDAERQGLQVLWDGVTKARAHPRFGPGPRLSGRTSTVRQPQS